MMLLGIGYIQSETGTQSCCSVAESSRALPKPAYLTVLDKVSEALTSWLGAAWEIKDK